MLFAEGMGVGLLFWTVAEPFTAQRVLFVTNFHWGVHASAI